MEELPEKKAPQSQPEGEQTEAETTPVAGAAGETAPERAGESKPSEISPTAKQAAPEQPTMKAGQEKEAEGGGDVPGSTTAASESGEEQKPEPEKVEAAKPNPEAAAETVTSAEEAPAQEAEASAPEDAPPPPQPVPSEQPDRAEAELALQAKGTEAETSEAATAPVAGEAPSQPAAETGTPPRAQVDAPASAATQGEQPAGEPAATTGEEDVQITASGAVMVPGEEAPRAEEPRPKKAPARPEKPTGPRISDLRPGQVVEGTVTRIEKYGAFVNLGLADRRDGLIHISELSPHRIRRVEDVVQVGEPVRARVVTVDLARGRIALSLNDVDAESSKEASVGPSEPSMTSMEMAFRDAQNRQRERESREKGGVQGKVGDKKRREQEELMRRLGSSQ